MAGGGGGGEIFSASGMLCSETVMLDAAPVFCHHGGKASRITKLHTRHCDLPDSLDKIRKAFLCIHSVKCEVFKCLYCLRHCWLGIAARSQYHANFSRCPAENG